MIIWTLVIVSAIVPFVLTLWFKNFRKKHKEFVSMIITLSATFVGVLLALSLNRMEVQNHEYRQVKQLLESAIDDIIHVTVRIRDYDLKLIDTCSTDSCASRFFMDNPLEEPGVLLSFNNNELMLRNMHYETNEAVLSQSVFLTRIAHRLSTIPQSNTQVNNAVTFYLRILWYIKEILDLQLQYSKGDITECDLILGKQELIRKEMNMDGSTLKSAINAIVLEYDKRNKKKLKECNE